MVSTHEQYSTPITWFCGVDGSDSAENCFEIVKNELFREHSQDHFVCGHIRNKAKTDLAWNHKPEYIEGIYSTKVMDLGKQGEFIMSDVLEGKSTKECLLSLANERHASIICTSMHGRKGPKE